MARSVMTPSGKPASRVRATPKSLETRARIVAGALRALEEYGLQATTTRLIAQEADVRLATLHYHFDSKDDVLLEVLDGLVGELMAVLQQAAGAHLTTEERIAEILRVSWAYVARTRANQIVQYELTLYALRSKDLAWLAKRQYDGYLAAYASQVRGSGNGQPQLSEAHADDLARLMLAGVDGLILQALSGSSDEALRQGLDALTYAAQQRAKLFLGAQDISPQE